MSIIKGHINHPDTSLRCLFFFKLTQILRKMNQQYALFLISNTHFGNEFSINDLSCDGSLKLYFNKNKILNYEQIVHDY